MERAVARPVPLMTIALTLATGVVAAIGLVDPAVRDALRRDPAALAAGHWWRLFSPLLVRTDGWPQLLVVLAGTLVAGAVVEGELGRARLLALFLVAGAAGQAAGYAWDPHGAGSSVAMLGLFAGIWALMLLRPGRTDRAVRLTGALGLALLASLVASAAAPESVAVPTGAGAITGAVAINLVLRVPAQAVECGVAAAALAAAVALAALGDDHGPAVLAGAAAAVLLLVVRPDG